MLLMDLNHWEDLHHTDDVKHVIKAFHGLMRNGIIISVVGEVISILISLMSKTKD